MTNKELKNTDRKGIGGRPKGSGNKLTAQGLLNKAAERDEPFEDALIQDWIDSKDNRELRYKYNQLLLNKVVADRHQVEIDETSTVENRQVAFLKALETIGHTVANHDNDTDKE